MIQAIIFDADGVVINTEPLYGKADDEFFSSHGVTDNQSKYRHLLTGKGLHDGTAIMKKLYNMQGSVEELAKERQEVIKKYYKNINFVPGFLNFYNQIKDTYKTAIATASNLELFAISDSQLHLTELFKGHIYYLKDVNFVPKPSPDIFLHAAKMLNVEPANCLVIEDAVNGVKAAKNANMRCIALATTHSRNMLTEADVIVDSYDQINLSQF